jgi:hypothetical protein
LTVKFTVDTESDWEGYGKRDCCAELLLDDILCEPPEGVSYEIISDEEE